MTATSRSYYTQSKPPQEPKRKPAKSGFGNKSRSRRARVPVVRMDIYPQDLGNSNYADVLNKRGIAVSAAYKLTPRAAFSFSPAPVTLMQRLWVNGATIEEEAAEHAAPAFDLCGQAAVQIWPAGFRWFSWKVIVAVWLIGVLLSPVHYFWPYPLYLCPLLALYLGFLKPRMVFKRMHLKLNYDDFAALAKTRDPLAGDFFRLVAAATKMCEAENSQDSKRIRRAFYELGNSISLLPPLEVAAEDAVQLQAQALLLEEQAKVETDPVVAASFQRRAEAVLQRAALAGPNNMISRRSQILRNELQEQIGVLRASLTAMSLNANHDAGGLADVAAIIQQIAGQASSAAAAQAELESAYAAPVSLSIAKAQVSRRNL